MKASKLRSDRAEKPRCLGNTMQWLVSVSVSYDVSIFYYSQYSLLLVTIITVPTVWNSPPYDLQSTDISLDTFKNKPNTFLFDADMH